MKRKPGWTRCSNSHLQHALTHMWQHLCVRALPCPAGSLARRVVGQNKLVHKKETSLLTGFIDCHHSLRVSLFSLALVRVGRRAGVSTIISHMVDAAVSRCQIFAFVQRFLVLAWKCLSPLSPCQIVSRYKKQLRERGGWLGKRLFLVLGR